MTRQAEESTATARPRSTVGLVATVAALALWNIAGRRLLHSGELIAANMAVGLAVAGIGLWAGLTPRDLGLARDRLRSGLLYGGATMAAIGIVVVGGALLPPTRHFFHNPRAAISGWEVLYQALVAIPLGTVFLEELAFRGTLLGLLRTRSGTVPAVVASALLFGLWHVDGVVSSTAGGALRIGLAVAGTFAATSVAGVGFAWLRLRSGSLLAPVLAHIATNSFSIVTAWAVLH